MLHVCTITSSVGGYAINACVWLCKENSACVETAQEQSFDAHDSMQEYIKMIYVHVCGRAGENVAFLDTRPEQRIRHRRKFRAEYCTVIKKRPYY